MSFKAKMLRILTANACFVEIICLVYARKLISCNKCMMQILQCISFEVAECIPLDCPH